jgi:hypothetical protein
VEFVTYEVHKKSDGTFDLFQNGKLLSASIPDEVWLKRYLASYRIIDDKYQEVLRQLTETRKATVELRVVKVRQTG